MADTIPTVIWSLNDGKRQHFWLSFSNGNPIKEFWQAAVSIRCERRLEKAFCLTQPFWYGLWIESPLSREQCEILHTVLTTLVESSPWYARDASDFLSALKAGTEGGAVHVQMSKPGHSDFGCFTTFVHCPRCTAKGPFEDWQEEYPTEPIDCPVCGFEYSPAATYSSEREYSFDLIVCDSCDAQYRPKELSEEECESLQKRRYYEKAIEELGWLERVKAFYGRYPGVEGTIKPDFFDSDDPNILHQLWDGLPLIEISLPAENDPPDYSEENREVIDYLRHHQFNLAKRLEAVRDNIDFFQTEGKPSEVICRTCRGKLRTTWEYY